MSFIHREQDDENKIKENILSKGNLPYHVAIIMDGNGRWARERGLPRIAGHQAGMESVRDIVEACGELGIKILTLYAFSVENWKRPRKEITALMNLLYKYLKKEAEELKKNNIKLRTIGRINDLDEFVRKELNYVVNYTADCNGSILNLAISYGGRAEIVDAVRKIVHDLTENKCKVSQINEEFFKNYLYTSELPDPDLLIRTSGEMRVSNFLLWQIAYTEIWVTDVLWPDFRRKLFYQAIQDYQKRQRRFGRVE